MQIKKEINKESFAVRISIVEDDRELGRAWLYIMKNNLHEKPFGFLEDVFVDMDSRKKGIGRELIETALEEAKGRGCYKIICTSRFEKEEVHDWYERVGFRKYGVEFRMDFN